MARWRRYRRWESVADFARDLPYNGRARIPYPPVQADAAFLAPDGVAGWHGYGADGWYRADGRKVEAEASEEFNDDRWPLNTSKWTITKPSTWWTSYGAGLAALTEGTNQSTWRATAKRWDLRGDFFLRLVVRADSMNNGALDGVTNADNAAWLGITPRTDPDKFWRVKQYFGKTVKGFAVEVDGDAFKGDTQIVGNFPAVVWLELQRSNGLLSARYRDATPGQPVGDPVELFGPLAIPGIVTVDFGARNAGSNGPWGAVFNAFRVIHGAHTYNPVASWRRETTHGSVFDRFEGDQLDPDLYTTSTTGNASAKPVAGLDAAAGPGLRLHSAGGSATVETRQVHGDMLAQVEVILAAETLSAHNGGVAIGLHAYVPSDDATLRIELRTSGTGTLTAVIDYAGGEQPYAEADIEVDADIPLTLRLERDGTVIVAAVYGRNGEEVISARTNILNTLPVALRLHQSQASASDPVTAYVRRLQVTSPWALRMESWPAATYATQAQAHPYEVSDLTEASDLTLIDPETRATAWAIYAFGVTSTPAAYDAQAAIQAGPIGRPFFDAQAAALWLPVGTPGGGGTGEFVEVNLREDLIRSHTYYGRSLFAGRVGLRHWGLGYAEDPGAEHLPPAGQPVTYARIEAARGPIFLWATDTGGVALWQQIEGEWHPARVAVDATDADPDLTLPFQVGDVRVYAESPNAGIVVSALAFEAERVLCVYRDLEALINAAAVAPSNRHAHASYGGTDPDARWPSRQTAGRAGPPPAPRLHGAAADGGAAPLDVIVPPAHALPEGDGLPLIATIRPAAVTLLQDAEVPAEAPAASWGVPTAADPATKVLSYSPTSAVLSPDADIETRKGYLAVGERQSEGFGFLTTISLAQGNVRQKIRPWDIDDDMRSTGSAVVGLASLGQPPDTLTGWRIAAGFARYIQRRPGDSISIGGGGFAIVLLPVLVLEYDVLAISLPAGDTYPPSGPHVGGDRVGLVGYDWTGEERIYTRRAGRDVEAFGVRVEDAARGAPPAAPKVLSAVVRALGWHEHVTTPVMGDEELAATAEWPADLVVVMRDGARIELPGGWIYQSAPCIEFTARRILGRMPRTRFDVDPKHDRWQRHLAIAIARLICRLQGNVLAPAVSDTYRATATGESLDEWGRSYAIVRPYITMPDGDCRDFFAEAVLAQPTPQRCRRILEAILGGTVEIVEGYREFTAWWQPPVNPEASEVRSNFWGAIGEAEPLQTAFYNRDFYGGVDARIVAAAATLDLFRPAGVRANIIIGEPPA